MSDVKNKYKFVLKKVKELDEGGTEYEKETYIGLTEEAGRYEGVIYKYGKVSIPDENEISSEGALPFRFEYDILDPYGLDREKFDDEFFSLIGDILVDIIDEQIGEESLEYNESND